MITFHELKIELPATDGTDMILLLPNGEFDILGECPQVEIMLIARQNVWDDTRLFLYLTITHQFRDALAHSHGVECICVILVIEQSPVQDYNSRLVLLLNFETMKKNLYYWKIQFVRFWHKKGTFLLQNLTVGLILSRLSIAKVNFFMHSLLQNLVINRNFAIFAPHLAYEVQ